MGISSRRELAELLGGVGLFARCTRRERATIARHMETAHFGAETTLIEEGEEGDAFFLILEGSAVVLRGTREVAVVRPGAYFGELALLDGAARSATVRTTEPATVAVLGARMFRNLLREFPELTLQLLAGVAAELRRTRDDLDGVIVPGAASR
jgi:CRP-like cAMP-binding protein